MEEVGKVNLFKFVVNPNDFAQSVENIFYLSFLIRDAKVAFETEDGEPVLCKYSTPELAAARTDFPTDGCEEPTDVDYEGGLKKRQIVLEFDMATWKVLLCIH